MSSYVNLNCMNLVAYRLVVARTSGPRITRFLATRDGPQNAESKTAISAESVLPASCEPRCRWNPANAPGSSERGTERVCSCADLPAWPSLSPAGPSRPAWLPGEHGQLRAAALRRAAVRHGAALSTESDEPVSTRRSTISNEPTCSKSTSAAIHTATVRPE